jgi:hypothetical protein
MIYRTADRVRDVIHGYDIGPTKQAGGNLEPPPMGEIQFDD